MTIELLERSLDELLSVLRVSLDNAPADEREQTERILAPVALCVEQQLAAVRIASQERQPKAPELVRFEWDDGPNAAAEFHRLACFDSRTGMAIEPERQQLRYKKNGKWSYTTYRLTVPAGTIIWQVDQDTSRNRATRVWQATTAGKGAVATVYGTWAGRYTSWPILSGDAPLSEEVWRALLRQQLNADTIASWEQNVPVI